MQTAAIAGIRFPLYTARPGRGDPVGELRGRPLARRSPNNVLWLVDPAKVMPGWRAVGAKARWVWLDGTWRRNDASLMRDGERRWWGLRHHVRVWHAAEYAVGQAHVEDWVGVARRRHRVLGLSAGRDAVVAAAEAAGCRVSLERVAPARGDWDGLVAVIRARA